MVVVVVVVFIYCLVMYSSVFGVSCTTYSQLIATHLSL